MSSNFRLVYILAVVAIQLLFIPYVFSLNLTNAYLNHNCNNTQGKYSQGSKFEKNLDSVFQNLVLSSFKTDFYYFGLGDKPNEVAIGMFQCRGDSYGSNCRSCIKTAISGLRKRCPRNRVAIIWYEQCLLEISTTESFNKIKYNNILYLSNSKIVSNGKLFNRETQALLKVLMNKASDRNNVKGNEFVLYAKGQKRIGTQMVYAMAQCTRDLMPSACATCFKWISTKYSKCCDGKQGGRILGPSCNFRYELYPFLRN